MKITKPFKIALGATIAVIAISAMIGSATEEVATEAETVTVSADTNGGIGDGAEPLSAIDEPTSTNEPTYEPADNDEPVEDTDSSEPVTEPEPVISDLTYGDMYEISALMTDLQFDKYMEEVEGTLVQWTGTVLTVDDEVFGSGYYAKLQGPTETMFGGSQFTIDISEAQALALNIGDEVTFVGAIDSISNWLDLAVEFEDVTVLSVTN